VLENAGGQDQGIAIANHGADGATCLGDPSQRIHGARVSGLTVNGFGGDGIFLFCVDGGSLELASANDDVEYGIFPSHCGPGRVSHCVATGANDTGNYIGQLHDDRIDHNLAMGNVSGFELENCSHSRLDHNEATGNTGGVLTFTNIFLDVKQNSDNRVDHNFSHDNNKPTAASTRPTRSAPCRRGPASSFNNVVTGNDSFGIAVANFCVANSCHPPNVPRWTSSRTRTSTASCSTSRRGTGLTRRP